jgi:hypothetical protein
MTRRPRSWLSLRQRSTGPWSNAHAAVLTAAAVVVSAAVIVTFLTRHQQLMEGDGDAWPFTVAWDPSWPSLPVIRVAGALSDELAEKIYALVGKHADTLEYMPCYCGCRSEGHQSVMQCYIRRRTPDGQIVEWHPHGRMCPMGADIAGDAVLWHQNGTPLEQVRAGIEREYSSRGPATVTPPVPVN